MHEIHLFLGEGTIGEGNALGFAPGGRHRVLMARASSSTPRRASPRAPGRRRTADPGAPGTRPDWPHRPAPYLYVVQVSRPPARTRPRPLPGLLEARASFVHPIMAPFSFALRNRSMRSSDKEYRR